MLLLLANDKSTVFVVHKPTTVKSRPEPLIRWTQSLWCLDSALKRLKAQRRNLGLINARVFFSLSSSRRLLQNSCKIDCQTLTTFLADACLCLPGLKKNMLAGIKSEQHLFAFSLFFLLQNWLLWDKSSKSTSFLLIFLFFFQSCRHKN